jgi:hypothetical protein
MPTLHLASRGLQSIDMASFSLIIFPSTIHADFSILGIICLPGWVLFYVIDFAVVLC